MSSRARGQDMRSDISEIIDAMDDYYPIESGDGGITTRLISTNGNGTADFNTTCPAQ